MSDFANFQGANRSTFLLENERMRHGNMTPRHAKGGKWSLQLALLPHFKTNVNSPPLRQRKERGLQEVEEQDGKL
jgi:hypothetical protein